MEYVRVSTRIVAPVDQVWAMVAAFGALVAWCPSMTACGLEGEGVGSIRTAHIYGITSREQLLEVDPPAHKIVYTLLPPCALPMHNIRSTMQLSAVGASATEVMWYSEADDAPAAPAEAVAAVEGFYSESLAGLKALLEKRRD